MATKKKTSTKKSTKKTGTRRVVASGKGKAKKLSVSLEMEFVRATDNYLIYAKKGTRTDRRPDGFPKFYVPIADVPDGMEDEPTAAVTMTIEATK